ncbi:NAD-binding protein [Shigella flexneri]
MLIVGGGFNGCELAMDFCRAGKAVTLIDNTPYSGVVNTTEVSGRLQRRLTEMGVHLLLKSRVPGLERRILAFWQRWTAA